MTGKVQRKNYRIDMTKLNRAREALGAKTQTETIHLALDLVANVSAHAKALIALVVQGRGHIEALDGHR